MPPGGHDDQAGAGAGARPRSSCPRGGVAWRQSGHVDLEPVGVGSHRSYRDQTAAQTAQDARNTGTRRRILEPFADRLIFRRLGRSAGQQVSSSAGEAGEAGEASKGEPAAPCRRRCTQALPRGARQHPGSAQPIELTRKDLPSRASPSQPPQPNQPNQPLQTATLSRRSGWTAARRRSTAPRTPGTQGKR